MADFVALSILEFADGTNSVARIAQGTHEECERVTGLVPSLPELGGRRVTDQWTVVLKRDAYVNTLLENRESALLGREFGRVGQA